jgi:hypothetical protein
MGLFDFLAGDPTKKWVRDPALKPEVDLRSGSLCGVRLGSRASGLSRLGPPSNAGKTKDRLYVWEDLGIDAFFRDGILQAYTFAVNLKDLEPDMASFAGVFLLDGKPLPLDPAARRADVVRLLGEPWHEFSDPEDDELSLSMYYETRTLEWAFEFLKAGTLSTVVLASPPDLEEPLTRKNLKCDKPWPP